uniref:Uncharacterized protein n=1 Tax=Anopheles coluzzii TaxID=1518534 RepID=A0A8W7PYN6_ANOCL
MNASKSMAPTKHVKVVWADSISVTKAASEPLLLRQSSCSSFIISPVSADSSEEESASLANLGDNTAAISRRKTSGAAATSQLSAILFECLFFPSVILSYLLKSSYA